MLDHFQERFGEKLGAQYLAAGLSYEEALDQDIARLEAANEALERRLRQAEVPLPGENAEDINVRFSSED